MPRLVARFGRITILVSFCSGPALLAGWGQTPQAPTVLDRIEVAPISPAYETAPGTGLMQFSVFSERSTRELDRQALVKLTNLQTKAMTWQTTEEKAQVVLSNLPFGSYAVEVSAVGYVTDSRQIDLLNLRHPLQVVVILQRDPTAINLDLQDTAMPPKGRKQTKQGVAALKSEHLNDAEKHLQAAYELAPTSAELNFLMGYLYFQKKEYAPADKYLSVAAGREPPDLQTLILLGRARLERKEYSSAQAPLEKAAALDSSAWLPHCLLADSYLRQKNYQPARQQAELAIEKGKTAAYPAQLVLGQTLIAMDRRPEGVRALNAFLRDAPHNAMTAQVQALVAEVEKPGAIVNPDSPQSPASLSYVDPLATLPKTGLATQRWHPPDVDEAKPSVATGVSCPLASVLESSGQRVNQLVEDVAKFAAVEVLLHQRLDEFGVPTRTETRKFNYVASITETEPGFMEVSEYRADRLELAGYPDHIASTGFAGLALVFHPHMQNEFEMTCEGLGDWQGQATWLIRFQQREDRPNRMHGYKVGTQTYPVNLKGRAWIRADNFQIVRVESDLAKPMPQVQLLSEHQVVEYAPIPFHKSGTALWLPKSAEIYFDFRRQRYYRKHSFDQYMLFAVNSDERRKEPTLPGNPPAVETPQ